MKEFKENLKIRNSSFGSVPRRPNLSTQVRTGLDLHAEAAALLVWPKRTLPLRADVAAEVPKRLVGEEVVWRLSFFFSKFFYQETVG